MNKAIIYFGIWLLCGTPAFSSEEEAWSQAAALYQAGEFASAYLQAEQDLENHPNHPVLIRLMGMCLLDAGYPVQAVALLREGVNLHPESVAMAFYLAQAYAYSGYYEDAIVLARQILDHAPESEYGLRCSEALPELLALQQQRGTASGSSDRFDLYVRVGWEEDDNVPARAKNDPAGPPVSSGRWTGSTYVGYTVIHQQAGGSPVSVEATFSGYVSVHEQKEYEAFDVQSYSPGFSLYRQGSLGSKTFFAQFGAGWSDTSLDGEAFSEVQHVNGSLYLQMLPAWTLGFTGGFSWKDFAGEMEFPEFFDRDGEEWQAGLESDHQLFSNRVHLGLRYGYTDSTTSGSQFVQNSHSGNATVSLIFPHAFRLSMGVGYQESYYPEFLPEPERLDDSWTYNATLHKSFAGDRLHLELSWSALSAESTLEFAEYEATIYGCALSYTY